MTQMTDDLYRQWEKHCTEAGHRQAQHGGNARYHIAFTIGTVYCDAPKCRWMWQWPWNVDEPEAKNV